MTRRRTARRQAAAAGFTLIETLVALAILGVVLSTVFAIFGGGLRAAHRDEDRLLLALVAQNLLDRSRLDLFPTAGSLSGDIGGGLRWRIDGVPYALPENLLPEALPEDPDLLGRREGGETAQLSERAASGFGAAGGEERDTRSSSFAEDEAQTRRTEGGFGDTSDGLGSARDAERDGGDTAAEPDAERSGAREPAPEREKIRLRLVTVTVEKGGERFALSGLVQEPPRDRLGAR